MQRSRIFIRCKFRSIRVREAVIGEWKFIILREKVKSALIFRWIRFVLTL